MTAEQKQRALTALGMWHSSNDSSLREYQAAELMAALLQELVDAPEADPVARVTGYYAGYLSIATVDGRVLPAGTALYLAPPAPSVPDWQGWAMRLIDFIEGAEVSSGMCCCGDDMARHASPINCGHSPVDMWDNCVKNLRAEFDKFVAAAPTPAEAPADVARDANRFRFANDSEEDFAICYWDESMGNGGEWMCYGSKGDAVSLLDKAIAAAIEREILGGGNG